MSDATVTEDDGRFRAFIQPIIIVIFITIILSIFTLNFYQAIDEQPPDISPIPEDPSDPGGIAQGALLNMLFYVGLAFLGGVVVLIIIKKGFMQFLVYFFAALMGFSWFVFGLFYGSILLVEVINLLWDIFPSVLQALISDFFDWTIVFNSQPIYVVELVLYGFAILLAILGTFSFGIQNFDRIWIRNVMMMFFGAMIGSMMAIHLGLLTAFLILIGLSIYDIYAVFKGPLKGIIDHGRETAEASMEAVEEAGVKYEKVPLLPALPVYSTPLINIGLGDFAFFSMLISAAVVIGHELANPLPLITTLIGLFLGVFLTFKFLEKERALPGLPLPIFGGILFLVIGVVTIMVIGATSLDAVVALFF